MVCRPDGSLLKASVTKEHTQYRVDDAADRDTFFLRGVAQKDVPTGSTLEMFPVGPRLEFFTLDPCQAAHVRSRDLS